MFDSHDDDLWEVPSIDVDVPAELRCLRPRP